MGKVIKDKYPDLDTEDQEAVRQHAIAALNLTQQAKQLANEGANDGVPNTALIDGVRRFAMDVHELDIDLIDRINPFGEAYAILCNLRSGPSFSCSPSTRPWRASRMAASLVTSTIGVLENW